MGLLDIRLYLATIASYRYALAKVDVPYNPASFPDSYAVGKDLDMYVSRSDYRTLRKVTEEHFRSHKGFSIRTIEAKDNFRLRLEEHGKLHFQIDITANNKLVADRVEKDGYYVLSLASETDVRLSEVRRHPHKTHHKSWLDRLRGG
jgi:hypothetical protein